MWLCLLLAALASHRVLAMDSPNDKPWFCHGLDCPDFAVKEITDEYEVRSYSSAKWISTIEEGFSYDQAVKKGFWKLFEYIGGNNEDAQKIEMTAPVRVLVHPSDGPFCESNFTISFFIPPKFQTKPPAPKDLALFVEESEAFDAFVVSYGGWQSMAKFTQHASALFDILHSKAIDVRSDEYYAVGYDSPFRLVSRHNEVWLIAGKGQAQKEEKMTDTQAVKKADAQVHAVDA